ncbi:effector-associated constant component EACC1 [Nocardia sp. NPDC004582]
MHLTVTVDGAEDDVAALHSLFDVLVEDDETPGYAQRNESRRARGRNARCRGPRSDNHRRTGVVGALSTCIVAWLQMHRSKLRLKITRADGTTVNIDATGSQAIEAAQVQKAIEAIREELDEAS